MKKWWKITSRNSVVAKLSAEERLLGKWRSDREATREDVTLEFSKDGSLTYTIHSEASDQSIFLRFRIEGDVIITDQPSAPREETTKYEIAPDGRLVLTHQGEATAYGRI
jgi:uncharacterized protein (TIGR03066 family)